MKYLGKELVYKLFDTVIYNLTYMWNLESHTEAASGMVVTRAWGGVGHGGMLVKGYNVSFTQEEQILELYSTVP